MLSRKPKPCVLFYRNEAAGENYASKWYLYQSIILIAFVLICVAPLIVFLTVKTTISGEVNNLIQSWPNRIFFCNPFFQKYIQALAVKSKKISQEQRRSERLILKLLPTSVATRLIEQKVRFCDSLTSIHIITYFFLFQKVSFSYDAATVMFCSLYGFTDLINTMEPLKVRKQTFARIKLLCSCEKYQFFTYRMRTTITCS